MDRERTIRTTTLAMVAALLPLLLGAPPVSAATQVAGSLTLSDATVAPRVEVTLSGSLPPRRARTVRLQTYRNGSWVVLASKQSGSRGGFSFTTTSPSAAGKRKYRVLAPAATLGGRRYAAVVTPTLTLAVVTMTAVTAGWRHACALGSNGKAWCWGANGSGELGIGDAWTEQDTIHEPTPVLGQGWTSLSAAGASTCGISADGGWCWGDVGSYLTSDGGYRSPVPVPGQWAQLSAGAFYFCGVDTDDRGWCQGRNEDGETGIDPSAGTPPTTMLEVDGADWSSITASDGFGEVTTCGIRTDRSAWCWGAGGQGQLGDGLATSSSEPVEVAGGHSWASLSVGSAHVCGVDTAGAGWCWGENLDGRLGDSTLGTARHQPVRVLAAPTWATLDAGSQHTCGVTTDRQAFCFGRNQAGQLGNGTTDTPYWPADNLTYTPLSGSWTTAVAGFYTSVALRPPGLVSAWGEAAYGQTGHGADPDPDSSPVDVPINP